MKKRDETVMATKQHKQWNRTKVTRKIMDKVLPHVKSGEPITMAGIVDVLSKTRPAALRHAVAKLVDDGLVVVAINGTKTKRYSRPAKHAGDEAE
jgi:hypothetical protein